MQAKSTGGWYHIIVNMNIILQWSSLECHCGQEW